MDGLARFIGAEPLERTAHERVEVVIVIPAQFGTGPTRARAGQLDPGTLLLEAFLVDR